MKADKPQKKLNSKPQNEMPMTKKKCTFGLKRQDVDKEKILRKLACHLCSL